MVTAIAARGQHEREQEHGSAKAKDHAFYNK
jgi:hypothetical protein